VLGNVISLQGTQGWSDDDVQTGVRTVITNEREWLDFEYDESTGQRYPMLRDYVSGLRDLLAIVGPNKRVDLARIRALVELRGPLRAAAGLPPR
jgi:hypothetical protein